MGKAVYALSSSPKGAISLDGVWTLKRHTRECSEKRMGLATPSFSGLPVMNGIKGTKEPLNTSCLKTNGNMGPPKVGYTDQ
jgi:hypothetical protein